MQVILLIYSLFMPCNIKEATYKSLGKYALLVDTRTACP